VSGPSEELTDGRIVLRRNSVEFAPHLCEAALSSLATVGRWMSWCHPGFTEAEAQEWYRTCRKNWDDGTAYEFSIFGSSGEFIGAAGLNQINRQHNFANLGYWIRETRQGHGYATVASKMLANFGLEKLQMHRIEIVVAVENLPSRRVAEKCGAMLEGVLRNRLSINGGLYRAAMYSMVPNVLP
jgi:ribosomal-protein-serine acetyltransferase